MLDSDSNEETHINRLIEMHQCTAAKSKFIYFLYTLVEI